MSESAGSSVEITVAVGSGVNVADGVAVTVSPDDTLEPDVAIIL